MYTKETMNFAWIALAYSQFAPLDCMHKSDGKRGIIIIIINACK